MKKTRKIIFYIAMILIPLLLGSFITYLISTTYYNASLKDQDAKFQNELQTTNTKINALNSEKDMLSINAVSSVSGELMMYPYGIPGGIKIITGGKINNFYIEATSTSDSISGKTYYFHSLCANSYMAEGCNTAYEYLRVSTGTNTNVNDYLAEIKGTLKETLSWDSKFSEEQGEYGTFEFKVYENDEGTNYIIAQPIKCNTENTIGGLFILKHLINQGSTSQNTLSTITQEIKDFINNNIIEFGCLP